MENVIISSDDFEEIKSRIISDGSDKLHFIADFDKTLTKAFVNGEHKTSIVNELFDVNSLDDDFESEMKRLYDEYHPIELDHTLDSNVRDAKMNEWWTSVFDLFKKEGINLSHLNNTIESGNIQLRDGVEYFLRFLRDRKVPLVIVSASGIGDLIPMYLESKGLLYDNITVVSNFFDWDSEGNMIKNRLPIIHSENKGEAGIENFPVYDVLLKRRNVILVGDSLGDVEMIGDFPYENIIRFCFLNEKVEERKDAYSERYDCVILNDGDFYFINDFLDSL